MNQQQVGMIMSMIEAVFPNHYRTSNSELTFKMYCEFLMPHDYGFVLRNMQHTLATSKFAPTIADLITEQKEESNGGRYIPNAQETKLMIEQKERERYLALTTSYEKPKKEQILAEREKALKTIANAVKRSEEENPYKWGRIDEF